MTFDTCDLAMEKRLQSHSAHFLSMYSLIPPQYVSKECEDEIEDKKLAKKSKKETRFWHNKKGNEKPLVKSRNNNAQNKEEDEMMETVNKQKIDVRARKSISLNDLQKRLQQKMAEVSNVRESSKEDENGSQQRRRRRRKRVEDREEEPNKKQRKLEDKKKHRENMKKNKEVKQRKVVAAVAKGQEEGSGNKKTPQLAFNRFEFNQSSKTTTATKKKDYKQLIAKAEAKHKKLQKLIELDDEKAVKLQERVKWSKAVRMAQGEKLKDDPVLLKKTVKRIEKRKQSHKKKWNERMKSEKQRQENKQKKRQENIQDRSDKIKTKKNRIRAKKRGFV